MAPVFDAVAPRRCAATSMSWVDIWPSGLVAAFLQHLHAQRAKTLPRGPQTTRSSGSSDFIHLGRKSHERSFSGSIDGFFACRVLMRPIARAKATTMETTTVHATVEPIEMPKMISGTKKKQVKRYAIANQRYLAVVAPRNLAALIGTARSGQMTYQMKMPVMLKSRCA